MSWYIQYLLRHREEIRADMYSEQVVIPSSYSDSDYDWDDDIFAVVPNFESDYFNDLLLIEKKIVELYKEGIISKGDIRLIELIGTGVYFSDLEKELKRDRLTIAKSFNNLCILLSYKMNGIFSDDEVCKKLQEDYKLTDEQLGKVKLFMKSNFKNKKIKKEKINV